MIKETKFLIKIAKKAASLITPIIEVSEKEKNGDLVTNCDLVLEEFLISKIKKKYPKFEIISEETNSSNALTENCFTIDPIDGTINFAFGLPIWGVQIACIKAGETISAVLYFPDLKQLYYADESGAFLNGKSIHVSDTPIEKAILSTANAMCFDSRIPQLVLSRKTPNIRGFGAGSFEFAQVARGGVGGCLILAMTPWDFVPGEYLVKQAGGKVYIEGNRHIFANCQETIDFLKTI